MSKDESGQMNNSIAWFNKHYASTELNAISIFPTIKVGKGAGFLHDVRIMRQGELSELLRNVRSFFNEFALMDFDHIAVERLNELLQLHHLDVESIVSRYSKEPID